MSLYVLESGWPLTENESVSSRDVEKYLGLNLIVIFIQCYAKVWEPLAESAKM